MSDLNANYRIDDMSIHKFMEKGGVRYMLYFTAFWSLLFLSLILFNNLKNKMTFTSKSMKR